MSNALKHDTGKPRADLLDPKALLDIANVLTFGAAKYHEHNWRGGLAYSRLLAATLRHIFAFMDGQDADEESGLPHIAHAATCCMMILNHMRDHPECDDRFKK